MPENEQSFGPRWLNLYKRRGRWQRNLYVHTVLTVWRFDFKFSRWHTLHDGRRDYHVEFGYNDGNEEDILNPNVQWGFHSDELKWICDYHADSPGWDTCSEDRPCSVS